MIEPGIIFTGVITCLGAVVWAVRVEGRVNGHDKLFEEREDREKERQTELRERLQRIEQKLDRYNGNGK